MRTAQTLLLTLSKTFFGTGVFVYLIYHLITGQNGLISYFQLKQKLSETQIEHMQVQKDSSLLENKVKRLYPNTLDADLLDEQLRRVTGKVDADEIIYFDK